MISYFAFSGLFNFISSFFLGTFIYLKKRKQYPANSSVLFFLSVAFWSFGYFFWQISKDSVSALFWSRVLMAGAIFIPIFYFYFIVSFLNLFKKYKKVIYVGYFLSFLFLILDFTPYFVNRVEPALFFPFWPKPGIFYGPFLLMFFLFVAYGWFLLLKSLKETKEITRKKQIKYFLLGTGIGFICGSTNYFLWYGIPIPPYLNILVSIYVVLTGFAILKYHLFEIKVILTEMLVGAMGIVLGIFVFIGPILSPNLLRFLSLFVFFFFLLFAYFLLKSVYKEEKLKEKVIALAKRERELRIGEQRLRHARDQFILSSQHYFRTPISSIIGYLQLVFQGFFGKVPEKMEEKLKNVYQSSLTLRDRIEECLEIALLQLKKAPLLKEEVSLKEIIDEIINETKLFFERKNLTLETIFPQEPLPSLYLDKKRIKEALFNLVDNAIKHTDQGKITLSLEKRDISLKLGNIPSILFIVKDTGVGIKKEELAFLGTAPFERGEDSRNLTMLGKGIGLYLSRLIIEAHQGKLWLESEGPNKGTTCFVELPLSQKPEKTKEKETQVKTD